MNERRARRLRAPVAVLLAACLFGCATVPAARTPGTGEAQSESVETPGVSLHIPERVEILPAPAPEAPPATDIFLIRVDSTDTVWRVLETRRLTDRDGYDNQPYFEPDGEGLLFVSMRNDQTDVFRYRGGESDFEQLTQTSESEYSPTPVPGQPWFSTVRVEADQTQRLWRLPLSPGAGRESELLFEAVAPVGYHAWINGKTVAMFVLGEPHRLVLGDSVSQDVRPLASEIGRAIHAVPGKNAVSYVDKADPERWWIALLDLDSGARRRLAETPAEREDFIWWSPRELLIGDASKLYLFNLDDGLYWREVADLSEHGIEDITRLSRSPTSDTLAVVGARPPR